MRFKTVRKEKDGVVISPFKDADHIKVSWKEFDKSFKKCKEGWVELSDEISAGIKKADDSILKAAKAFIRAESSDTHIVDLGQMSLFAQEIHAIQETLGCGNETALVIVRNRIGSISGSSLTDPRKERKERKEKKNDDKKENRKKEEIKGNTFALLSENTTLLSLKEKLEKR